MNIDKRLILELKQNNSKIADIISQLSNLTDEQIVSLYSEISKLRMDEKIHEREILKKEADLEKKKTEVKKEFKLSGSKLYSASKSLSLQSGDVVSNSWNVIKSLKKTDDSISKNVDLNVLKTKDLLSISHSNPKSDISSIRFGKKTKLSSKTIMLSNLTVKNLNLGTGYTPTQNKEEDFTRHNDSDTPNLKIKVLKSILGKLDFKTKMSDDAQQTSDKSKDESNGFSIKNALMGTAGGAGLAAIGKKVLGSGVGKTAGKLLGKFGGKAIPILGTVLALNDLRKKIMSGYSEYQKYAKAGNDVAASGVISYTMVGALASVIDGIAGFTPPLISIPLLALGSAVDMFSEHMKDTNEKTAYVGAEGKKAKDLLLSQEAQKQLQMRPNQKGYWEYRDYDSGTFDSDWKPILDNTTGKPLSILKDNNKVSVDNSKKGYGKFTLSTMNGTYDLVYDNGPKMVSTDGSKHLPIKTGADAGKVKDDQVSPNTVTPGTDKKFNKDLKKIVGDKDLNAKEPNWLDEFSFSKTVDKVKETTSNAATTVGQGVSNVGKTIKDKVLGITDDVKSAISSITDPTIKRQAIRTAYAESRFKADAKAKTASAGGLYQFVLPTWRGLVQKYNLGYSDDDRFDPKKATIVYSYYQRDVNKAVDKYTGGKSTDTDYYMNNFMGSGGYSKKKGRYVAGAKDFYKAYKSTPDRLGIDVADPSAVKANKPIFYKDKNFTIPRTVAEVYAYMQSKIDAGEQFAGQFETGTNRIRKSGVALIHKGEMIIPAKNASKIRSSIHSNQTLSAPISDYDDDDEMSEDFWINTFMVSLANVVKQEYLGADDA